MDVQALSDRAEITDVLLRYYRACDCKDPAGMRATFFDDATVDYGPFYVGDLDGFMAAADSPAALGGYDRTMHFVGNMLIELDGDVARTETYVIGHHTTKPDHEWTGAFVLVYMRYLDRFERRGGRWASAYRTVVYDWVRKDVAGGFEEMPPEALTERDFERHMSRETGAA
jgi:hypothetical protein